jgi:CMP-N-acetylneuraminic acid synthetase
VPNCKGKKTVLAVIPARAGSKGILDKNIRSCNGKPLLAYSIEAALAAESVSDVIVSTDSEEYAAIACRYGAKTPFLRPADIAGDNSLDIEVFEHVLRYLSEYDAVLPEIIVHLRPTHPIREPGQIDKMVQILRDNPYADSLRSVSLAPATPYKMWLFESDGSIKPVASCSVPEAYNAPRQSLPEVWLQNACVDVIRTSTILNKHSMTGDIILGYKQDFDFDIDTEGGFIRAEHYLDLSAKMMRGEKLTFCFDIDGLIAHKSPILDYSVAKPNTKVIETANYLRSLGHRVVIHTARGSSTGIDWEAITVKQLTEWGVEFDALTFGKPSADIYIDDRLMDIDAIRNLIRQMN